MLDWTPKVTTEGEEVRGFGSLAKGQPWVLLCAGEVLERKRNGLTGSLMAGGVIDQQSSSLVHD